MNHVNINGYTRITKQAAHKRHNEGLATYMMACKLAPGNHYIPPVAIPVYQPQGLTFSQIVNAFEYYNCTVATGKYIAFYVKEV